MPELENQQEVLNSAPPELTTQVAPEASTPEEVLDTRSPEEIEAAFLKQAEDDARAMAENRPPEETAAIMFHMFYPQWKSLLIGLSNKELRRLVQGLVGKGHSSEPAVPKFTDQRTGTAYKLGLELMAAKFMMIQKIELDAFEKAQNDKQQAQELAAQAVITEERGEAALEENTNG